MLGFTELVRVTRDPSVPPTPLHERFLSIERDAHHLAQLAESVLTLSRDGSSALSSEKEVFQVGLLLDEAASELSNATLGALVRVSSRRQDTTHVVSGDPGVYRTILDGLVRRLMMRTGPGTEIRLAFDRVSDTQFSLSVYTADGRVPDDSQDNSTIVPITAYQSEAHPAHGDTGLLLLLAETRGASHETFDATTGQFGYSLVLGADLVASLSRQQAARTAGAQSA